MTFSVHEAKTQLSKLLDLVEHGEKVVIVRHGKPVARLVGAQVSRKPRLGALKDEPKWPEGWDKPLSDDEADAFLDGQAIELTGSEVLPIRANHVSALHRLPDHHRDPFDRIIAAQAIAEGLPLIASDPILQKYPLRFVW